MNFLRYFSSDKKILFPLKNVLGFTPNNIALYQQAFRHKSAAQEIKNGLRNSNERLEYLGDAILGAVVADFVFKKFPYKEEGFLTEMRSKIVSRDNLNKLAIKLGLDKFIQNNTDYSKHHSINGNAFEALIGAIYLDKGYKTAYRFIVNHIIKNFIDVDLLEATEKNFKSKLIEWAQKERKIIAFEPVNEIPNGRGKPMLKVQVIINKEVAGTGIDFSKKKAEQLAAEEACKNLKIVDC